MPVAILAFVVFISKVLNLLWNLLFSSIFAENIYIGMKKYLYIAVVILACSIVGFIIKTTVDLKKYKELYNRELTNVEAYDRLNSDTQKELREFKFTMSELRASKDSINQKLIHTLDSIKLKDKNIQYLQYNTSIIQKTDTVVLQDTIFRTPVDIDTVIGDKWYNLKLGLKYPSTIITEPTFNSEKQVIISTKKEYNKKPSKIFFIRWFQKKHQVVTVDVIENNPYIENKDNRFIKVVKD